MAIMAIFEIEGMTTQKYDQTFKDLGAKNATSPEGLLYHVASSTDTGMVVVAVWESKEKMDQFRDVLTPIIRAADMTPDGPEIYPVHNIIKG